VYWILCCPHADQILPKLPAPHTKLSRPKLDCTPNVMAGSILFTNSDTDLQKYKHFVQSLQWHWMMRQLLGLLCFYGIWLLLSFYLRLPP